MSPKIPMITSVRGYAVPSRGSEELTKPEKQSSGRRKSLSRPREGVLIFDTETTNDAVQSLRFGTYQVRKCHTLLESGIFYEPDNLRRPELALLNEYAAEHNLFFRTREEFVREVFYRTGYHHFGTIVGFNLPFDLSRIAIDAGTSHGKDMRGGFSLKILSHEVFPRVLVKHVNSKLSFMRFASPPRPFDSRGARKQNIKTQARAGFFLDVKTLGSALLAGSHSLASLANLLGTEHRKTDAGGHGATLTRQYIDYAVNDTQVTWEIYEKLLALYATHGLGDTPPHRIFSEAALGKAYLRQMGILPWRKVQREFPDEIVGIIMSTFYGGRSEVRIRKQTTRVLYCDFRSMYPTVCTLMGLWDFVTASGVEFEDWTLETASLLERVTLADLQRPGFWKSLHVLVQIEPDGDILPVRAAYGGTSRTIGLNFLSADFPVWYTLADCIASKLLSGKVPKIVRAIKFRPKTPQLGMKPIRIGGDANFEIDPAKSDFFKRVIDLRGLVQIDAENARKAGDIATAERLDAKSDSLKLLANSTSYGIYAELNTHSHDRPRYMEIHGGEATAYETGSTTVEEAGTNFHPLVATLITGAARLMLAISERVAADNGIDWAFCDTDSMALARPKS